MLLLDHDTAVNRIRDLSEKIATKGDDSGSLTRALSNEHETVAIAEYVLNANVALFRSNMQQAASLQYLLHQQYTLHQEAVFPHFVSAESVTYIFDALASGDFQLARQLASCDVCEVPNTIKNRFSELVRLITANADITGRDLSELVEHSFYRHFVAMIRCIAERGNDSNKILANIERAHRADTRSPRGVFSGTCKEFLSIWGIGLGRLAVESGILSPDDYDGEFIPHVLLLPDCRLHGRKF